MTQSYFISNENPIYIVKSLLELHNIKNAYKYEAYY